MPSIKQTFYGLFRQFSSSDIEYTNRNQSNVQHSRKQSNEFHNESSCNEKCPVKNGNGFLSPKFASNNTPPLVPRRRKSKANDSKLVFINGTKMCGQNGINKDKCDYREHGYDPINNKLYLNVEPTGNNFIDDYLAGRNKIKNQPEIFYGRTGSDLPLLKIEALETEILSAYTGPDGGLTKVPHFCGKSNCGPNLANLDDELCLSVESVKISNFASTSCQNLNQSGSCPQAPFVPNSPISPEYKDVLSRSYGDTEKLLQTTAELDFSRLTSDEISNNFQCKRLNDDDDSTTIDWFSWSDFAFGLSTSLYEQNPLTHLRAGSPIADVFAVIARANSCILALADGVNWGEKSRLAARCAVRGALDYLHNSGLFSNKKDGQIERLTTKDIFHHLLRAFHAGHSLIVQERGSLTTLCVAFLCPLLDDTQCRWVACVCNVGDSLAFAFDRQTGVREITQGSHDIKKMRDMRDAGGALGPVDGINPELHNMTCSMTIIFPGDLVFLTSDGISDNFDPVVGKFCSDRPLNNTFVTLPATQKMKTEKVLDKFDDNNGFHSSRIPRRIHSTTTVESQSGIFRLHSTRPALSTFSHATNAPCRRLFGSLDSHVTTIKNLPCIEAYQRHELMLLRLEDMLRNGVTVGDREVRDAKTLCQTLINFANQLTSAKRKTLEDPELYTNEQQKLQKLDCVSNVVPLKSPVQYNTNLSTSLAVANVDDKNDDLLKNLIGVAQLEQKKLRHAVRRKIADMPGKLDHASVVAYLIPGRRRHHRLISKPFNHVPISSANLSNVHDNRQSSVDVLNAHTNSSHIRESIYCDEDILNLFYSNDDAAVADSVLDVSSHNYNKTQTSNLKPCLTDPYLFKNLTPLEFDSRFNNKKSMNSTTTNNTLCSSINAYRSAERRLNGRSSDSTLKKISKTFQRFMVNRTKVPKRRHARQSPARHTVDVNLSIVNEAKSIQIINDVDKRKLNNVKMLRDDDAIKLKPTSEKFTLNLHIDRHNDQRLPSSSSSYVPQTTKCELSSFNATIRRPICTSVINQNSNVVENCCGPNSIVSNHIAIDSNLPGSFSFCLEDLDDLGPESFV